MHMDYLCKNIMPLARTVAGHKKVPLKSTKSLISEMLFDASASNLQIKCEA